MNYLRYLPILFFLLIPCCGYHNQMVVINFDEPKLKVDKYYNKKLNLKVVDSRENKEFIGFKTPVSIWRLEEKYKNFDYNSDSKTSIAKLNNNQDLELIVQKKLSENLNLQGLKLKRFTINQLSVEIIELSFIPTAYRVAAYSKIMVKASNKSGDLEKIYSKQIIDHKQIRSEEYYNRIINDCLNQNIQSIISDNQLWNFLD